MKSLYVSLQCLVLWNYVKTDGSCSNRRVDYTNTAYEECALIHFPLQCLNGEVTLSCTGLTMHTQNDSPDAIFKVCLPEAQNFVAFKSEYDYRNHTCTLEVLSKVEHGSLSSIKKRLEYCQFNILSFFGRILPSCSTNTSSPIETFDIREDEGTVLLHFVSHTSDLVTILYFDDSDRPFDKDTSLLNNVVALSPLEEMHLSISYQPDCDSNNEELPSRHFLEVYRFCQNGMKKVLTIEPEFNREATRCSHIDSIMRDTKWVLVCISLVLLLQLLAATTYLTALFIKLIPPQFLHVTRGI